MNAYLKEIADLCNIKKNLLTHTARHFCYNRNSNTRGFNGGCFKNARPFESLYNKAICTNCGYTYNWRNEKSSTALPYSGNYSIVTKLISMKV